MFLELRSIPPRRASATEIINRLRPKLARVEGITLYLQAVQDVRVGGRGARTQYQFTLQDVDLDELNAWAPRVLDRLRSVKGLQDVASDQQISGLELDVNIDRDTASRLGITPRAIDATLYDAFGQRQVATTFTQVNQYRVVLEVKPAFRDFPDDLTKAYVDAPDGGVMPMRTFTTTEARSVPLTVNHQTQFPSITISFNLAPGTSLGEAVAAIRRAEREIGVPPTLQASFSGTAQAFQASLATEPMLILVALLTVYMVLGVLYESCVHPITILSTLPSAGIGALLALLLCRTDFSVIALIGVILLIGIVKKNAILMIDFAIEAERERNLSSEDAIYQACVLRFRPIMMTTLAAL
ncbi:MAG: efflux RND transporter permease subunit, partial [Polyangiaceae bacterium]